VAEVFKIDNVEVQSRGYGGATKYTSICYCTYRTAQQKHPGRRILNGSTQTQGLLHTTKVVYKVDFYSGQIGAFVLIARQPTNISNINQK
jgi:hypothetical protein